MQEYRRKHFLTEKKYQLKYTLVILMAMVMVALVVLATAYWDISQVIFAQNLENIFQLDKYLIRIGYLLIVAFFIGTFLSHKIIGPLKRIENAISAINKGEFKVNLVLRDGDDFKALSENINQLAKKLDNISEEYPEIKNIFQNK